MALAWERNKEEMAKRLRNHFSLQGFFDRQETEEIDLQERN
jgi:hypothetical protein